MKNYPNVIRLRLSDRQLALVRHFVGSSPSGLYPCSVSDVVRRGFVRELEELVRNDSKKNRGIQNGVKTKLEKSR